MPVVSVVIPLYNKELHIARAVQSVLNQTHGDLELIVVDDGSTDGGAQAVEAVRDQRVRLIRQANGGVSAARNCGIAEARADLVAFLDADDEWLPEHLATAIKLAERFPECGAFAAAFEVVDARLHRRTPRFMGIPEPPWEGIIPSYFRSSPVWTSAVVVPRRVFDAVGLFPVGVARGEDLDMWVRIALRFPIAYTTQVGAIYRRDAAKRLSELGLASGRSDLETGLFKTLEDALESGALPLGATSDDLFAYRNTALYLLALDYAHAGHGEEARLCLRKVAPVCGRRHSWLHYYAYSVSFLPRPLRSGAKYLVESLSAAKADLRRAKSGNKVATDNGRGDAGSVGERRR
jgi:glycosyltransferase involved in cell wall biosynthesis